MPEATPAVRQVSAKLKMKSESWRRAMRSTALGASVNCWNRVGLGVVDVQVVAEEEAMTELGWRVEEDGCCSTGVWVADVVLVSTVLWLAVRILPIPVALIVVFDTPYGAEVTRVSIVVRLAVSVLLDPVALIVVFDAPNGADMAEPAKRRANATKEV